MMNVFKTMYEILNVIGVTQELSEGALCQTKPRVGFVIKAASSFKRASNASNSLEYLPHPKLFVQHSIPCLTFGAFVA